MEKHYHTEQEFAEYIESAENDYEVFNGPVNPRFAKQAVEISRLLGVSLDNAEWLIETFGVYIPNKDRDLAVMVVEMGITFEQASTLYEAGFHFDPAPQSLVTETEQRPF